MDKTNKSFRTSHTGDGYGEYYSNVYKHGYYKDQWELIEKPILRMILKELKNEGSEKILDFACGTGRITQLETEYYDKCYGVDVSETMLEQARQRNCNAIFIKNDLTKNLLDEKFDIITAFRFFLNAEDELRRTSLLAISKMLKNNGVLVANIHVNSSSILGYTYRIRNTFAREIKANTLSVTEFNKYLEQAGFNVEKIILYSYFPRIGWFYPKIFSSIMISFEEFQKKYALLPKIMGQSFVVIARKTC